MASGNSRHAYRPTQPKSLNRKSFSDTFYFAKVTGKPVIGSLWIECSPLDQSLATRVDMDSPAHVYTL